MAVLQAVETLAGPALCEPQRQRALAVNRRQASGSALEMNGHVAVNAFALPHGGWHKSPRFLSQRFHIGSRDFNLKLQHRRVGSKYVRPRLRQGGLDSMLVPNGVHVLQTDHEQQKHSRNKSAGSSLE